MEIDSLWVMNTFGFKAGLQFMWDSFKLWMQGNAGLKKTKPFHKLSNEEASQLAFASGIYYWEDRNHLNEIWEDFRKTMN